MVQYIRLYRCSSSVMGPYSEPCSGGHTGDTCLRAVAVWEMGGGVRQRQVESFHPLFLLFVCLPRFSHFVNIELTKSWSTVYPRTLRGLNFQKMQVFLSEVRTEMCSTSWKSSTVIRLGRQVNTVDPCGVVADGARDLAQVSQRQWLATPMDGDVGGGGG